MPASSKLDLLLAKAKPIRDVGSTSVRTYLRRGKKPCCRHQGQGRRRGRRCSRCWRRCSPAADRGDHSKTGCAPAAHG